MNFQQLEYIVAIDTFRHFVIASQKCNITQPTLSMMVQKLEDELGVKIFDRNKKPVEPTIEGIEIINRAKRILAEAERLKTYVREIKGEISGDLRIGIIPTLAPYLLPLFLKNFIEKHPFINVFIKEIVTDEIIHKLKTGELDIGILATPIHEKLLTEHHLFNEEFFVYTSQKEEVNGKKYLLPTDLDISKLWLLEEGHCLRNQIFNLCELKINQAVMSNLHYEAGSIETLINMVDKQSSLTIIPHLAALNLNDDQKLKLKEFANPKPIRQISLVVTNSFPRLNLLNELKNEITKTIPFESPISMNAISIFEN
ncbi:MAG: LysR substrate-binding domain-containing protein [Bacteroidota bacterium]